MGKYRKVPHADIQGVLEISYYSLSELERKIFLDCACFFKGEKWVYVERVLEACDYSPSFRVFASKCLMTIDENGCLEMHDLIQDMGREVVRKKSLLIPGNRSRLWYHKDILQVLKENSVRMSILPSIWVFTFVCFSAMTNVIILWQVKNRSCKLFGST